MQTGDALFRAGDFAGARQLAERAQRSQFTGEGAALRLLIAWLGETEGLRNER